MPCGMDGPAALRSGGRTPFRQRLNTSQNLVLMEPQPTDPLIPFRASADPASRPSSPLSSAEARADTKAGLERSAAAHLVLANLETAAANLCLRTDANVNAVPSAPFRRRPPSVLGGGDRQTAVSPTLPFAEKDRSEVPRPHDPDVANPIVRCSGSVVSKAIARSAPPGLRANAAGGDRGPRLTHGGVDGNAGSRSSRPTATSRSSPAPRHTQA